MKTFCSNKQFNYLLLSLFLCCFNSKAYSDDTYQLRMFFGLSKPNGGAISLQEWQSFQQDDLAIVFDGFNVVDSVGYYKGKPERSKIVTVIVAQKDIVKAKALASRYSKRFQQDSVMITQVPVMDWSFVGSDWQPDKEQEIQKTQKIQK